MTKVLQEYLCRSLCFNEVTSCLHLYSKEASAQVLSCEFCKKFLEHLYCRTSVRAASKINTSLWKYNKLFQTRQEKKQIRKTWQVDFFYGEFQKLEVNILLKSLPEDLNSHCVISVVPSHHHDCLLFHPRELNQFRVTAYCTHGLLIKDPQSTYVTSQFVGLLQI